MNMPTASPSKLKAHGIRVEIDKGKSRMGGKIRDAANASSLIC